jgi:DNA-binding MarR family transcriptional regulator
MIEKIKTVSNPLTIIAIFAALAEIATTIALVAVAPAIQEVFVWFVMAFPTLIVLLFFATLNWNSKVLYAPSDFKNEENYMHTIAGKIVKRNLDLAINLVEEETAKLDDSNPPVLGPAQAANAVPDEHAIKTLEELTEESTRKISDLQAKFDTLKSLLNDAKHSVNNEEPEIVALSVTKLEHQILRALGESDRPLMTAEIAGLLLISPTLAAQIVKMMNDAGVVTVDARTKVRLKDKIYRTP